MLEATLVLGLLCRVELALFITEKKLLSRQHSFGVLAASSRM
jgi:hypothetical protein